MEITIKIEPYAPDPRYDSDLSLGRWHWSVRQGSTWSGVEATILDAWRMANATVGYGTPLLPYYGVSNYNKMETRALAAEAERDVGRGHLDECHKQMDKMEDTIRDLLGRAEAAEQRALAAEAEVVRPGTERARAQVDACLMLALAWELDAPGLISTCSARGMSTMEIVALRGLCERTIAADRSGDLPAAILRAIHNEGTVVRGTPACVAAVTAGLPATAAKEASDAYDDDAYDDVAKRD